MTLDKNLFEKEAIERQVRELLRKETLLKKEIKDKEYDLELVNHDLNYLNKRQEFYQN